VVVFVLILSAGGAFAAPQVVLNGQELVFDVPPVIEQRRTLVPFRAIFEALGANVSWDGSTQTVTAVKGDTEIKLTIGGPAYKNGQPVTLDVPAKIVNERTLVPLRFVSEVLGASVWWNDAAQTVTIYCPRTEKVAQQNCYFKNEGRYASGPNNIPVPATKFNNTTDAIEIDFTVKSPEVKGEFCYDLVNAATGEIAMPGANHKQMIEGHDKGTGSNLPVPPGAYIVNIYFNDELIFSAPITVASDVYLSIEPTCRDAKGKADIAKIFKQCTSPLRGFFGYFVYVEIFV
jgi:hypothetical protein